jgi:hypothetical protein
MSKVVCTKCGALILETTAQRNGGLCVPCKSGKRESVEAAKKWHKEQREREKTDPFRILWHVLVHRVHETSEGFSGLSEAEKRYFAVGLLAGEVYNGGFDQYFFNHSGCHYKYALLGLEEMEATQTLALLQRAKQALFNFDEVPEDTGKRRRLLQELASESRSKRLDELDAQYYKDPDGLSARAERYARAHGLV